MSQSEAQPSIQPEDMPLLTFNLGMLFDMRELNKVFDEEGAEAHLKALQKKKPFKRTAGFDFARTAHGFFRLGLLTRAAATTHIKATQAYTKAGISFSRATYANGTDVVPFLNAAQSGLFLTTDIDHAKRAVELGLAAAYFDASKMPNTKPRKQYKGIHLILDLDGVVFDAESEIFYQNKLAEYNGNKFKAVQDFEKHEEGKVNKPLKAGPLGKILKQLHELNRLGVNEEEIIISVVTARSGVAGARAINTLHKWGVNINGIFSHINQGVDGVKKGEYLKATAASYPDHFPIFFDDSPTHVKCGQRAGILTGHVIHPSI